MTHYYAGIGSRNTPIDLQLKMKTIASQLALKQWILRSGGAQGADSAFESGCDSVSGEKQIFIPWNGFNGRYAGGSYIVPPVRQDLVELYHPHPYMSAGALKLQSRNSYQVLGHDLCSYSSFVICWTPDGKDSGGTGQAIRIARDYDIRVYNLHSAVDTNQLVEVFELTL